MAETSPIAVLGAGSWGTALAILLARNGLTTTLWGHDPAHMAAMADARCNRHYLPDAPFPERLSVTADLAQALSGAATLLAVVPSSVFRTVLSQAQPHLAPGARIAWGTKGIDPETGKLLHEVVEEVLGPRPMAVVSGPSFAREVAAGMPTAITVAANDGAFATELATLLHSDTFRAYTSGDLVGVQLGGSVKNVMAVAAGISDGLGFGANARAALITRGLAEMVRLGTTMGGHPETFMGLAGLGDLVLTCTDDQSRNRRFGLAVGRGIALDEAETAIGQVVEGKRTAAEVQQLAGRHGVEMPITEQVYRVLYQGEKPHAAVSALLAREQKAEAPY